MNERELSKSFLLSPAMRKLQAVLSALGGGILTNKKKEPKLIGSAIVQSDGESEQFSKRKISGLASDDQCKPNLHDVPLVEITSMSVPESREDADTLCMPRSDDTKTRETATECTFSRETYLSPGSTSYVQSKSSGGSTDSMDFPLTLLSEEDAVLDKQERLINKQPVELSSVRYSKLEPVEIASCISLTSASMLNYKEGLRDSTTLGSENEILALDDLSQKEVSVRLKTNTVDASSTSTPVQNNRVPYMHHACFDESLPQDSASEGGQQLWEMKGSNKPVSENGAVVVATSFSSETHGHGGARESSTLHDLVFQPTEWEVEVATFMREDSDMSSKSCGLQEQSVDGTFCHERQGSLLKDLEKHVHSIHRNEPEVELAIMMEEQSSPLKTAHHQDETHAVSMASNGSDKRQGSALSYIDARSHVIHSSDWEHLINSSEMEVEVSANLEEEESGLSKTACDEEHTDDAAVKSSQSHKRQEPCTSKKIARVPPIQSNDGGHEQTESAAVTNCLTYRRQGSSLSANSSRSPLIQAGEFEVEVSDFLEEEMIGQEETDEVLSLAEAHQGKRKDPRKWARAKLLERFRKVSIPRPPKKPRRQETIENKAYEDAPGPIARLKILPPSGSKKLHEEEPKTTPTPMTFNSDIVKDNVESERIEDKFLPVAFVAEDGLFQDELEQLLDEHNVQKPLEQKTNDSLALVNAVVSNDAQTYGVSQQDVFYMDVSTPLKATNQDERNTLRSRLSTRFRSRKAIGSRKTRNDLHKASPENKKVDSQVIGEKFYPQESVSKGDSAKIDEAEKSPECVPDQAWSPTMIADRDENVSAYHRKFAFKTSPLPATTAAAHVTETYVVASLDGIHSDMANQHAPVDSSDGNRTRAPDISTQESNTNCDEDAPVTQEDNTNRDEDAPEKSQSSHQPSVFAEEKDSSHASTTNHLSIPLPEKGILPLGSSKSNDSKISVGEKRSGLANSGDAEEMHSQEVAANKQSLDDTSHRDEQVLNVGETSTEEKPRTANSSDADEMRSQEVAVNKQSLDGTSHDPGEASTEKRSVTANSTDAEELHSQGVAVNEQPLDGKTHSDMQVSDASETPAATSVDATQNGRNDRNDESDRSVLTMTCFTDQDKDFGGRADVRAIFRGDASDSESESASTMTSGRLPTISSVGSDCAVQSFSSKDVRQFLERNPELRMYGKMNGIAPIQEENQLTTVSSPASQPQPPAMNWKALEDEAWSGNENSTISESLGVAAEGTWAYGEDESMSQIHMKKQIVVNVEKSRSSGDVSASSSPSPDWKILEDDAWSGQDKYEPAESREISNEGTWAFGEGESKSQKGIGGKLDGDEKSLSSMLVELPSIVGIVSKTTGHRPRSWPESGKSLMSNIPGWLPRTGTWAYGEGESTSSIPTKSSSEAVHESNSISKASEETAATNVGVRTISSVELNQYMCQLYPSKCNDGRASLELVYDSTKLLRVLKLEDREEKSPTKVVDRSNDLATTVSAMTMDPLPAAQAQRE